MSTTTKEQKKLIDFLNPDYVFIPIPSGYDIVVGNNQTVLKWEVVAKNDERLIVSSVSGTVVGLKSCLLCDGTTINSLAILNDFKEKQSKKTGIKKKMKFSKEEIIKKLKEKNVDSQYKQNLKLDELFSAKMSATTLIVNAVEVDNLIYSNKYIMNDNVETLLDIIDTLSQSFKYKYVYLVLDSSDHHNVLKITELLGAYPKIKIKTINNKFPSGLEHVITSSICGAKYAKDKVMFLGVADIFTIHNTIIREKYTTERIITITGDAVKETMVFNTKLGTLVKQLLDQHVEGNTKNPIVYIPNNTINGKKTDINNLIVTPDLEGLIINVKKEVKTIDCLNCGKCSEFCPVGINPKYIKDNTDNPEKLKKAGIDKCLDCGLCSYSCSANINLREYLNKESVND